MRKKIMVLIILLIVLLAGSSSFAIDYNYNSIDVNELNKRINDITTKTSGITEKYGEYQLIIEDDADLLNSSEELLLKESMIKLTEYGNIIFKSIDKNTTSTASYAKSYYNNRFGKQSGTVFLIEKKKKKIYIFSNGDNYTKVTDSKAETITDNIYEYATDKEYYKCAKKAFEQILTVIEGGKIAEPMKYISNAVLAVMISLFINFAIFKLATNNSKANGTEQIKECERFLEHTPPVVTKVGQHREYSPQSSSSGGGGGRRWRRRPEAEVAVATASKRKNK